MYKKVCESTPLLDNNTQHFKCKKRFHWWRFQCCIYGIAMFILSSVIVVLVSKNVNKNSPQTPDNSDLVDQALGPVFLFTWPMPDVNISQELDDNENLWYSSKIAGAIALENRDKIEQNTSFLNVDSPSYKHQHVFPYSEETQSYSRMGYARDFASKFFFQNSNYSKTTKICPNKTEDYYLFKTASENVLNCSNSSTYRSYNGSCNNLLFPNEFGVTFRNFRRLLTPDYGDGLSSPRKSYDGKDLPSARLVSNKIHPTISKNDPDFTVMLAVWGQFIDHDITATAPSRGPNGSAISCCVPNSHPECFPVLLDQEDPYYKKFNVTCMEFVRSSAAPGPCLGYRDQISQTTAFLDGSVIYGSDEETSNKLRTFEDGELKMLKMRDNRTLLPISEDLSDGCNRMEEIKKGRYCFMTGDSRSNENLLLTSMHLIWARHHNAIAKELSTINPNWTDEVIFQETRKIIGAQMQHITYNEFLPIILGKDTMGKARLESKKQGYFKAYNINLNPTIANCFATSAFRFAHSIIPSLVKLAASRKHSEEYIRLHDVLFDPFRLYSDENIDRNLQGAMQTSVQTVDPYFSEQLREHLFETINVKVSNKTCGLDLVSLNIQRGRDHGLPGYIKWLEFCGFKSIKSFNDLKGVLNNISLNEIQKVYRNVEDIDLYTGALSENHYKGSILGPTFLCLVTDQFVRLKQGDRFWYENPPPTGFSKAQLIDIRKTTLAKILCDNSDNISSIPQFVMKKIDGKSNKYTSCSKLQKTNLKYWRNNI